MNKPVFDGEYCHTLVNPSSGCPFLITDDECDVCCTAYTEYLRSTGVGVLRHEKCISEHGLDGSQWSKEPPTEPGWYWVAETGEDPFPIPLSYEVSSGGEMLWWDSNGDEYTSELTWFGPRIEFPELPEGE